MIGPGNGLNGPGALLYRNGDLFVSSYNNNRILRYDGTTGVYKSTFELGNGLTNPAQFAVLQTQAVPEPSSFAMLGIAASGLWALRRKLKHRIRD